MVIIDTDLKNLVENAIIAFSTVSADGIPNTIAVACAKVVSPNQVLITDNFFNKTRQNLLHNQHVSLAVWNTEQSLEGSGYQLKGIAQVLTSGKYKEQVDQLDCNQGLAHKAAILVTVSEIWDLAEPHLVCRQ